MDSNLLKIRLRRFYNREVLRQNKIGEPTVVNVEIETYGRIVLLNCQVSSCFETYSGIEPYTFTKRKNKGIYFLKNIILARYVYLFI